MIDWHTVVTVGMQIAAAAATIAAIRTDIKWLKRWTRDHEHRDDKNFETVNERLGRVEGHLLESSRSTHEVVQ